MLIRGILIAVAVALTATGCTSAEQGSRPEMTYEQQAAERQFEQMRPCAEYVGNVRAAVAAEPMSMHYISKGLLAGMFSCEYYLGEQMQVRGYRLKIDGKPVLSGLGYTISDGGPEFNLALSIARLEEHATRFFEQASLPAKVSVDVRAYQASPGSGGSPLYLVYVLYEIDHLYRFSGEMLAAALVPVKIRLEGWQHERLLALWIQDDDLTPEYAAERLRKLAKWLFDVRLLIGTSVAQR